jgi:enoyl-CoA hydratase/carnithine racemase
VTYETLAVAVDAGVCTLTLNRPDKLNTVTGTMIEELIAAFDRIDADDAVRVVIVTGAGRAFCAGADLSQGGKTFDRGGPTAQDPHTPSDRGGPTAQDPHTASDRGGPTAQDPHTPSDRAGRHDSPSAETHRDGGGRVTLRIFDLKKPVIAAINGAAVGFGATFTLAMDIRIASSAAKMGFVFARRGVVPEACSTWFLPRIVGIAQAAEWAYSGRVFDADEALRGGLVSRVVSPHALMPTAHALAREIADNTSAVSVALIRQMMWKLLGADHPMAAHRLDSLGMFHMGRSPDAYEGVTSFMEKRPAKFTMKPSTDMPPFYPFWEPRA